MNYFDAKPKLISDDQSLISSFNSLKDFRDVCNLLELTPTHLHYILFEKTPSHYYNSFTIPKKNGGVRNITASNGSLKILQEKLNQILQLVYTPNAAIHGFTLNKSIVTNASKHLRKKNLLNFDLLDFFPSINLGRVRGVLISFFGLGSEAATIIANICCYNNSLPQGSPTSPILSNMICFDLDKQFQSFAMKNGCIYTRYADDITFSTSKSLFPKSIAFEENEIIRLGPKIIKILEENSFKINPLKTRLNNRLQHLGVTGITVNEKLNVKRDYIKKIRAILRCLEINSLENAQSIFETKYKKIKNKKPNSKYPSILTVVRGMINHVGHVKGNNDYIYLKLSDRFNMISPEKLIIKSADLQHITKEFYKDHTYIIDMDDIKTIYDPKNEKLVDIYHGQGTGFLLKGIGIVTNAHVFKEILELMSNGAIFHKDYRIHAYKHDDNEVYLLSIAFYDLEKDIMILTPDNIDFLSIGFDHNEIIRKEQLIDLIGYPNYLEGQDIRIENGFVQGIRIHRGNHGSYIRYEISPTIYAGNSGGPIVNKNKEVIAVAVKGVTEHGVVPSEVIPISEVIKLAKDNGLLSN